MKDKKERNMKEAQRSKQIKNDVYIDIDIDTDIYVLLI